MSRSHHTLLAIAAVLLAAPLAAQRTDLKSGTKFEPYFNVASPLTLISAAKVDRVAWKTYEKGMRNVYTAAAPLWKPVKLTKFNEDNGIDVSAITLSDDGSVAVFVRGSAPNSRDWVANPTHDPDGPERAIWAVKTTGGPAWRVAAGAGPSLSPDGKSVLFVKDGQIFRARVLPGTATTAMDKGERPFITAWGRQSNPRWSPDGRKIAFVSDRENHAFIAVYDVKSRTLAYLDPSVDCDGNPVWSDDSRQLVFTRRPGTPFGAQNQDGAGVGQSAGSPAGIAQALQQIGRAHV